MTTPTLRTEYRRLSDIAPAVVNPKRHDLADIRRSYRRFGFAQPVLDDGRTGRLIAGHGRLEALVAHQADGEPPPRHVLVADDGEWLVPVTEGWSSSTDVEAHALGLGLNKIGESLWDRGELADLLESFALAGEPLDGTGFNTGDLDELMAELAESAPPVERPAPQPRPERTIQGMREVVLLYTSEDHRAYGEAIAKLRRMWNTDEAPRLVLRAVLAAAED